MLEVRDIKVKFGGLVAVDGVSFDIGRDKILSIIGPNGAGKTTTLRTIMGVLPVRSGRLTFDGRNIAPLPPEERARAGIGYVPQGRDIFPHLSVEENLQISLVVSRQSGAGAKRALERVYGLFPVLQEMLARKGGVLSGGQQQQLAIARALLTNPKLLILDEPTEGIQPSIIDHIGDTLQKLKREGFAQECAEEIHHAVKALKAEGRLAILLVEQYVDFCREVADRFYILDRGAAVATGPIATLTDEVVKQHLQV